MLLSKRELLCCTSQPATVSTFESLSPRADHNRLAFKFLVKSLPHRTDRSASWVSLSCKALATLAGVTISQTISSGHSFMWFEWTPRSWLRSNKSGRKSLEPAVIAKSVSLERIPQALSWDWRYSSMLESAFPRQ